MNLKHLLYVFGISILPIIELRGAIPVGAALKLPMLTNAAICIIGNMLPVPFILWLFPWGLALMKKIPGIRKIAVWLETKIMSKSDRISKGAAIGLFFFVAIPLPGTGAWTGAALAALLGMNRRYALISVFFGVLAASVIMAAVSYGFLTFLDFLL